MCENRHSLRVGAGFVIDSGRHGHARGSCRTYGRKERAHRSLQNHRTVLHKLPHASSSCPIRRPKHQNLSGCWVATHRFCGGGHKGYFDNYARFFVRDGSFSHLLHDHLSGKDARHIDTRIDAFNQTISDVADSRSNWFVVDTGKALSQFAVRRNEFDDDPGKAIRCYYADQGDHPLLQLDPLPSLLMLQTAEDGRRLGGGLTSLDGVHPTTIGYGIIAEVFLAAMRNAGVNGADPARLDWPLVMANDTLLQSPPKAWDDVVAAAERFSTIWDLLFRVVLGK